MVAKKMSVRVGLILGIAAVCLLVASTMACAGSPAKSSALYKAGTYTASAPGIHGDIEVQVKFSATAILEVKILKSEETQGVGDVALTTVADEIVKGQTLNVDTVSGASVSSQAVLDAVEDCVKQAGGDVAALKAKK